MDQLSKKERVQARRQEVVQDFVSVFIRDYEMSRAWGMFQPKAYQQANKLFVAHVARLSEQSPQEKTFLGQCKTEAKELIKQRIAELEKHNNEKSSTK